MTRRAYLPGLAPEPASKPEQIGLGIEPERDEALSRWFTPPRWADALVDLVADLLRGEGLRPMDWGFERLRILEPSAGSGAIVRALRRRAPYAWIEAVEIDPRWESARLAAILFALAGSPTQTGCVDLPGLAPEPEP